MKPGQKAGALARAWKWIKDTFIYAWKWIVYEARYPYSSTNLLVQYYIKRIDGYIEAKMVGALEAMVEEVKNDKYLNRKEIDGLLGLIAWPSWFPVERI